MFVACSCPTQHSRRNPTSTRCSAFRASRLRHAILVAVLFSACSSVSYGQPVHSLSLDSVSTLHSADTVYSSLPVAFHFRLTADSTPGNRVTALWNAFEVYSPSGAYWVGSTGSFTDAITGDMLGIRMVISSGISGSGSDTIGFHAGSTPFSCGLPESFDEVSMRITIGPIDTTFVGHVICLDSVMVASPTPLLGDWDWRLGECDVVTGNVSPDWDGPHCFTIINPPCAISVTGDVNDDDLLTAADVIHMVNYVFKGGPDPEPCQATADVGCNGDVTSADIIYLVNHVFKSGPVPCNVCALIWSGQWSCP